MPTLPEPLPQFRDLTENEIMRVMMDSRAKDHPIAREVARLMKLYTFDLRDTVQHLGHLPSCLFDNEPETAIQVVAAKLIAQAMQNGLGALINANEAAQCKPRKPHS